MVNRRNLFTLGAVLTVSLVFMAGALAPAIPVVRAAQVASAIQQKTDGCVLQNNPTTAQLMSYFTSPFQSIGNQNPTINQFSVGTFSTTATDIRISDLLLNLSTRQSFLYQGWTAFNNKTTTTNETTINELYLVLGQLSVHRTQASLSFNASGVFASVRSAEFINGTYQADSPSSISTQFSLSSTSFLTSCAAAPFSL